MEALVDDFVTPRAVCRDEKTKSHEELSVPGGTVDPVLRDRHDTTAQTRGILTWRTARRL
jgi:hypothetical protein